MSESSYFAAVDTSRIGERLVGRLQALVADQAQALRRPQKAWEDYYAQDVGQGTSTEVRRKGEQGEYTAFRVNRARSLVRSYLALVLAPKVTWRPQAKNGDAGAAAATSLCLSLCEELWKAHGLSASVHEWTEKATVLSKAWLYPEWDFGKGPALAALEQDDGALAMPREGDFTFHVLAPWDVYEDGRLTHAKYSQWRFVRLYKNKWDLLKLYPALADGKPSREFVLSTRRVDETRELVLDGRNLGGNSDLVPVWHFLHAPTPSLPMGRRVVLLNAEAVLEDATLDTADMPLFRLAMDEMFETPHAWSQYWDTLGAQEMADEVESTLASILSTLGKTAVALERGTETDFLKGLRVLMVPKGGMMPQPVQLAAFPPDALAYRSALALDQRQLMGLNDVALGQPDSAQMNAQAFAVLASMAVQQAGPFQTKLLDLVARVGTHCIQTYRRNVSAERVLSLVGQQNKRLLRSSSWTGGDLGPIEAVRVEIGNPLEQTPSGRMALVQLMAGIPGLITSAEQIQQVVETGRLEPVLKGLNDENQLISEEYEQLQRGEVPIAHATDNHPLHYRMHARVLSSAEARQNPQVVSAVQEHLDAHYTEYFGAPPAAVDPLTGAPVADPMLLQRRRFLMGHGPDPVMLEAPPAAPAPEGLASDNLLMAPVGPARDAPKAVSAPTNPVTNQPFDSITGGGVVSPE